MPNRTHPRCRTVAHAAAIAILGMATLHTSVLVAQGTDLILPPPRLASCLDSITMTNAARRIVYVHATVRDSVDSRLATSVDLFAQSVATHLRTLLDARGDTLPMGEPTIGWRTLHSHTAVGVVARPHVAPTFQLITTSPTDSVAATLLLRAAVAAQHTESDAFFWTDDIPGDSLAFGLAYTIAPEGAVKPDEITRVAFPVFTVAWPAVRPAAQILTGHGPRYPESARTMRAKGVVVLTFVVDTTGHADLATVHEQWPKDQPRPTGDLRSAYDAFLRSTKEWLPSAQFTPAQVGGCRVRQLVQQPFVFDLR